MPTAKTCNRRYVAVVAAILVTVLSLGSCGAPPVCPSQPWNTKCNKCCEQGWLACTCASTDLRTGYPVPCCRQGKLCPPCVEYQGCRVFDNCKTCHINTMTTHRMYDGETRYCSSCYRGWSGNDCKKCGGIMKEKVGSIEIENYPNEVECLWTIDVTRNSLVELRFERFSLESDPACTYDALTLYDGAFLPRAKSKTICGMTAPQRFVSKTHVLVLHFKSDETTTQGGFRVTYRELNACARRPCLNGGACMLTTSTDFVCVCTLGFSGTLCEIVIRCHLPPLSPYLTYTLDANGLSYGAVIKYGCDRDFFPRGPSDAYCKANGRWTENPPICIPACRKPRRPANGHIDGGIYTVGAKITYSCKIGYNLNGVRTRECRKNHEWSETSPLCEPNRHCVDPGVPDHGLRTFVGPIDPERSRESGQILPRTQLRFECAFPYKLNGTQARKCLLNGTLTGEQPSCVPDPVPACPPVNLHQYGNHRSISIVYQKDDWSSSDPASNSTFSVGTRAEVTCFAPFVLRGSMSRLKCSANGTWERLTGDDLPKCLNVTSCPRLPPFPEGRIRHHFQTSNGSYPLNSTGEDVVQAGIIPVGTTATYTCNSGVLTNRATRECLEDGSWSGVQPACVKGCKDPGKPRHSTREAWIGPEASQQEKNITAEVLRNQISRNRFPARTVLQFECADENFFLQGIARRVCLRNGRWSSPNNPRCLPKCGVFPKVVTPTPNSRDDLPAPESWPWHAVLRRRVHTSDPWSVQCGGAYIGHNLVLTVAQCVTFASTVLPFQPYEIQVGLGVSPGGGVLQEHEVSEIIVHTDFDPILHDYDIALLVLSSEVRLDDTGRLWPVCVPADPEYKAPRSRSVVIGERATVSAWTEHHVVDAPSGHDAGEESNGTDQYKPELPDYGMDMPPNEVGRDIVLKFVSETLNATIPVPTIEASFSTLSTPAPSSGGRTSEKVEHFDVTREISTKCERVFRDSVVASRMLCGLQAIATNRRPTEDRCFERKGNPLVVVRAVRHKKQSRRRMRTARKTKKRRPRCACRNRKTRHAFEAATKRMTSGKNHPKNAPHTRIKRNAPKSATEKNTSPPTHAWVLEGLSSWTARGSCIERDVNRYTVFLKVRAFTEWIALKRKELLQKGLLLPPN